MGDDTRINLINDYLTAKHKYQEILNEFNYYKHEVNKENLNLKMENKKVELIIRNLISSINDKEEELSKIVIEK